MSRLTAISGLKSHNEMKLIYQGEQRVEVDGLDKVMVEPASWERRRACSSP